MTPIWLTAGAAATAFLFALFVIWVWGTADSTTVIVVRHAETGDQAEAKLSVAGTDRARLLARMFGALEGPGRLDAIYVSDTSRSRLTAEPLAERLHVSLTVAVQDDGKALARRALREHGGGRVLIVANLDTLPVIVASLSGTAELPQLDAGDYGVIYVVTVPRIGHANVLRLSY